MVCFKCACALYRAATPIPVMISGSESLTITASFEQSTETSNFDAVPIICALAGTFLGLGIFLLVALLRKIYCKGNLLS